MAKIIKVGSQNPTFTSTKTKKASSIQTHRNSNEATNPFKFTNFEGNTLQFADVFEGFKPQKTNKLRMIAASVTGSMSKVKSIIPESIVNFAKRVVGGISQAWDYAKSTNVSDAILAIPGARNINDGIRRNVEATKEFLNTPVHIPGLDTIKSQINATREFFNTPMTFSAFDGITEKINNMASKISFHGKQKYANMSVAEIENAWKEIMAAEGGIE